MLSGLKILDMSRVLAGPHCAMLLGELGAEVLKVESPGGDDTRGWGPPYQNGESAYFIGANRNKHSITLDLRQSKDLQTLRELIPQYDAVVENFKLGTLARWGFDADWFARHAPQTVHCSITGFGPSGPRAADPGYDFVMQAECGLMAITGPLEGEPVKHGVAIVDTVTGLYAAISILGALLARQRQGVTHRVSTSLFETGLSMLINVASNVLISGQDARRFGNGHPNIVPYRTFLTADQYIALAVGNDTQFERLAILLGREQWNADERFKTNSARVANRERVDAEVQSVLLTRTADEWFDALRAEGIPAGKVCTPQQALAHEQAIANQCVMRIEHPQTGSIPYVRIPIRVDGVPVHAHLAPPTLGEHNSRTGS